MRDCIRRCYESDCLEVSEHVKRIEAVEKEVRLLSEKSATREEASKARSEAKKLFDSLHIGKCSLMLTWHRLILFQSSLIYARMSGVSVSAYSTCLFLH